MGLQERIETDLKDALRSSNTLKRDVLRMLKARILEAEVECRSKKGRDYRLSDEEVLEVISRYAKQRRQSIEAFEKGGRQDLVEKERGELEILETYLPRRLSAPELERMIEQAIEAVGATSAKDMGRVMNEVMKQARGAADGREVSEMVRRALQQLG